MSESTRYTCKKCAAVFRADRWVDCSNCGEAVPSEIRSKYEKKEDEKVSRWQELLDVSKNEGSVTSGSNSSREPSREISVDAKAIITSQNRTTYAIRSLAIFLFTTLCTSLFGYGLIGAGTSASLRCDSYYSDCGSGFMIWGWVIIAVGFIVGLIVGINELGKSRP
jgi:uncharacterized Zn finger protein (UPF0148 family)